MSPVYTLCDVDRGSIVEQGTHEALMRINGHYARLYRLHEHYRADWQEIP